MLYDGNTKFPNITHFKIKKKVTCSERLKFSKSVILSIFVLQEASEFLLVSLPEEIVSRSVSSQLNSGPMQA